jgi:thymidylate kinase
LASSRVAIIVGIDGAGKSTVIRRLMGYQTSHYRMLRHVSTEWATRIDGAEVAMSQLRGKERTEFILELVEAEWNTCIAPNLVAGRDVVCDGFYLRPLVKEMVFGDGDVDAVLNASPLTGDELVVMIDTPVELAVRRKHAHEISRYECFTSPADFADFQTRQQEQLLNVLTAWNHVIVDGTQNEDVVAREVLRTLEQEGILPAHLRD